MISRSYSARNPAMFARIVLMIFALAVCAEFSPRLRINRLLQNLWILLDDHRHTRHTETAAKSRPSPAGLV